MIREEDYRFFFEKVLTFSDDGYIIVDKDGIVVDINENYRQVFKKPKEEIVGYHIYNLIRNSKIPQLIKERGFEQLVPDKLIKEDLGDSDDSLNQFMLVSRSYVENDAGEILGGIAQIKMGMDTNRLAKKMAEVFSEFEFYRHQYKLSKENCVSFENIIGSSPCYENAKKLGRKASQTKFEVLLTGETGTGKEVFARAIHNGSCRAQQPMICVNCAAIPNDLLESELFGYEEGAFTGAKRGGKIGKFQQANGGTIFLDEIGDMPLNMQAKILRVLQEKEVEPVGGSTPIKLDMRVISATRKNLFQLVQSGSFREDLYYRLNVVNIELPPLRKRQSDILQLVYYFLDKLNTEYRTNTTISQKAMLCLKSYSWPGNVRELENVIKSAYATCEGFVIGVEDLPQKLSMYSVDTKQTDSDDTSLSKMIENYERMVITNALESNHWNYQLTAQELNISRSSLYNKTEKLKIMRKRHDS